MHIVSAILPGVESECDCSSPTVNNDSSITAIEAETVHPVCSDSSSATGVGLLFGGLVAGALGVLLIEGIVCGACLLRKSKVK